MADSTNGNGALARTLFNALLGFLGLVLVGMVGWNVSMIVTQGERISALETAMPIKTEKRYTSDDAARDREEMSRRFLSIELRLQKAEDRR